MSSEINIRKANDKEIKELLSIWINKAEELNNKNIGMWDTSQFTIDNLNKKYDNPEFYIRIKNREIFGGFILLEFDRIYWPENSAENAYYFHKFVVKTKFAGQGLSDQILNWVKRYAKDNKQDYVRLDYNENREYLKKMYTRHGFETIERMRNESGNLLIKAQYKIE
jgi:GNAT superfamily N-acetyltransferase